MCVHGGVHALQRAACTEGLPFHYSNKDTTSMTNHIFRLPKYGFIMCMLTSSHIYMSTVGEAQGVPLNHAHRHDHIHHMRTILDRS